jgi:hypothetical protein
MKIQETRHETHAKLHRRRGLLAGICLVALYGSFGDVMMYELNQRVIAVIDGSEKTVSVVGRTFESEPRYDVRLSDGSIVANITTIRELDT